MAAGSAAASSTPITSPVPVRREYTPARMSVLDQVQTAQALRLGAAQISRVEAENGLIKAQARRAGAEADVAEQDRDYYTSTTPFAGPGSSNRFRQLHAQVENLLREGGLITARKQLIDTQGELSQLEFAIRDRDFDFLKEYGIMEKGGQISKQWSDVASLMRRYYPGGYDKAVSTLDIIGDAVNILSGPSDAFMRLLNVDKRRCLCGVVVVVGVSAGSLSSVADIESDMLCLHPIRLPSKLMVPCGHCTACRVARYSEWSTRLFDELDFFKNSVFLTLTYKDECLPDGGSLCKLDLQKFFRSLRKAITPFVVPSSVLQPSLRYYGVGEYGETYGRLIITPLYIAILIYLRLYQSVGVKAIIKLCL